MTTEEKKIEEAAKDHCLYDRNICEEDDALCNLSEQMFILGAKSNAAKEYHTKGVFTEEQCYRKLHNLMTDIKLNGVAINDDTDLKQWFDKNKTV